MPFDVSAAEQPQWILDGIEAARRVWFITQYKPANRLPLTEQDDDYMRWVWNNDE